MTRRKAPEPLRFLGSESLLEIHHQLVQEGDCAPGLLNLASLEAAVAMPQQVFAGEYLHPTVPAMAAAYCFHLCQDHPFVDGNKRTAVLASGSFLDLNGFMLTSTDEELYAVVIEVAQGKCDKACLTEWFTRHTSALSQK